MDGSIKLCNADTDVLQIQTQILGVDGHAPTDIDHASLVCEFAYPIQ